MIGKLRDLNLDLKTREKELAVARDRLRRVQFDLAETEADLIANTPWKEHGITNQHGRESFIILHTVDETHTVYTVQKEVELMEVEVNSLKRLFNILLADLRRQGVETNV